MPVTAFIVRVPEAEARVGELRRRFDPTSTLGVPAHITVLFPFLAPEQITADILREIREAFSEQSSFDFVLASVERFPATAYLAPEPTEPFIALTESLVRRFPAFPPFSGEFPTIIPHLTVANGNAADAVVAAAELNAAMAAQGPIRSSCHTVELLENSSGHWQTMHVFILPRPRDATVQGEGKLNN